MIRRRLQFHLSTLFWLTTIVASFFGGVATERWLGNTPGDHIQNFSFFMGLTR